jgi:cytochrome c553
VNADWWRPLALGLAAAALYGAMFHVVPVSAQPVAERITQCSACHGEDGNSRIPNIPSLAGQPEFYLTNQLFLFREGVRTVPGMSELLTHFAALEPKASDEAIDPALVKRGAALIEPMRCVSCHLPSLAGQEQMPRLAKQRVDYLIHSLKEFRDNTRTGADTLMSNVVIGASNDDLAALAHYAASR